MMRFPVKLSSNALARFGTGNLLAGHTLKAHRSATQLLFERSLRLSSSALGSWSAPVVESKGDYRDEAFLEDEIGGPLYEFQKDLPKLPIPSVQESLERFLPTALPLCRSEEEEAALRAACDEFPKQAEVLQERLQKRSEDMHDSSWLQLWWNQLAYLQYRDSVVVNVSYWFQFEDDDTIEAGPRTNVERAASLLYASGEFRKSVCSGERPADKVGRAQTPLCSTPFKYLFNACRIPRRVQDTYKIYDPSRQNHAVVARKGHFFAVEFVDESGDPLPLEVLEDQIEQCIELADAIPADQAKLGILTASNRDMWADARDKLIEEGGVDMENALEKLESGAIVVCLDDDTLVSRTETGGAFLTGGKCSENRWFDKASQILVAENGKSGQMAEHSMMDGMVLANLTDHLAQSPYAEVKKRSSENAAATEKRTVQNIFGEATSKIDGKILQNLIDAATDDFDKLSSPQENTSESFQGYGSTYIKSAGYSPDAYVQMAMQLAAYRLFGEQVGTYEATQVRPFLHGRTETTRSVSQESGAFLKAMGVKPTLVENDAAKRKEKLALLQAATKVHSKFTGEAAQGMGVDRHFFGLGMLVEEGEDVPPLLNDPVFVRSKTWRMSTSNLTHPRIMNWGFGQVVPDGLGIGYSVRPESCVFNIAGKAENEYTSKMAQLIEDALLEMRRLIEQERSEVDPAQ